MSKTDELKRRIAERLATLGISERAASIKATGQPDTLRFIRTRDVMPSWQKLIQIAEALETSTDYLVGETDHPGGRELRKIASRIVALDEHTETMRRDARWLKIHAQRQRYRAQWLTDELERLEAATAAGEPAEMQPLPWERTELTDLPMYPSDSLDAQVFRGNGDRIAAPVTGVDFTAEPSHIHRPPALHGKKDAYAFVIKDSSMAPRTDDHLVICDPSWPPVEGDEVAVHLVTTESETPVLYRKLGQITAEHVWLTQFDPPTSFMVPRREVVAMHRVATLAEILSIPDDGGV